LVDQRQIERMGVPPAEDDRRETWRHLDMVRQSLC
jgi:hypothetical protein